MNPDTALPTFTLEAGASLAQAQPWLATPVTLESPALSVMTDLSRVKAASTGPGTLLRHAEQMMIYQGVRMLFVVGDMPAVEGLVSSADLQGERPLRRAQALGLRVDELDVAQVMTPLAELDAVAFDSLRTATVANLVATLKRHGHDHLLVVQDGEGAAPRRVRGVVSRTQIERQLGTPLVFSEIASSFSAIEKALA